MDANQPGVEGLRPDDPERIGSYQLVGRLGEGGMGTVYLGLTPAGRSVAVKVVRAEVAIEDGFAARFHAEVRNAQRVASFCTAQVLDHGNADGGRPYMVTEYIPGTPLSRQISRHGALEPASLHGMAVGVAAALAAIHVAGLVHRDLKPANVILSMSGPRVIDFGIARALDSPHAFTRSGEILGTPGWWAPEQVSGAEVTQAADIFAWGCLIAYAGNGRHPYGSGNMVTMANRLLNSAPDLGTLPAPLDELVRRATAMDPALRPTAQDLLIALVGGDLATPVAAPLPPSTVVTPVTSPSPITGEPPARPAPPPADAAPDSTLALGVRDLTSPLPPSALQAPAASPASPPADTSTLARPATAVARTRRRRWLLAGPTVVVAVAVTVAVLTHLGGTEARSRAVGGTTGGTAGGDVGRRIATGSLLEDPQLIVSAPPRCGLTSYGEITATAGRLCVVGWTLVNTGGNQVPLNRTPLALVDDSGAAHAPMPARAVPPGSLTPGGRADGVLVYDLPPGRKPLKLSGRVTEGGGLIEVRL